ncbi:MAG: VC0807 family protein [Lysinibacillus sp.]
MKGKAIFFDLLFYVVMPLVMWNTLRESLGDYATMLLASVPGIIYTVFSFIKKKRINFLGLFMLITLVIGTVIDILSGSALQMMWNNVYYGAFIGLVFIASMLVKRPIAYYFALDGGEMMGYERSSVKMYLSAKRTMIVLHLITFCYGLRSIIVAGVNVYLIRQYGVEAFDQGIVFKQVVTWTITIITAFGFLYVMKASGEGGPEETGPAV